MGQFAWALAGLALLWSVSLVGAAPLGTVEEARAMLVHAIAALKSNEAVALTEFNDMNNKEFHDRDLYVVCYNMSDGKISAYSSPVLLGVDIRTLTLKDDPIGQRAYDAVHNSPNESVVTIDYNFPKPGTTGPAPKRFIETRVGDRGCGVAYYE